MSRSLKKAPYVEEKLYTRICAMNEKNEKKVIKTWSRASTIFPDFIGHTVVKKQSVSLLETLCFWLKNTLIQTYYYCFFV